MFYVCCSVALCQLILYEHTDIWVDMVPTRICLLSPAMLSCHACRHAVLFVCVSVTFVYFDETILNIIQFNSPSGSHHSLQASFLFCSVY